MPDDRTVRALPRVAHLIANADALLITAGAGMGVDSGLPDFRGPQGFWRGYPALEQRGLTVEQMAQPAWFLSDPETAWAFYGHRQQLYRGTKPHMGYWMLRDWAQAMRGGYFVVTSNVDEQFEAAGFAAERIVAIHGSLHVYQCLTPCRKETWRDEDPALDIDVESMRARGELPRCPFCGGLARPNVLLFDDGAWVSKYRDSQRTRYLHWLAGLKGRRVVVVELGAGTAIPTIRRLGEDLVARGLATLVRINPQASDADEPAIPIRMGALEALWQIETKLPAAFKTAARAGTVAPWPTKPWVPPANTGGLEPLPAEHMDTIEFFETTASDPPAAWLSAAPKATEELRSVTSIDLDTGHAGPFNYIGISTADEQACMDCWHGPQKDKYAPLPEVAGQLAPGFLMTGRVVRAGEPVPGRRPGAVIMYLCDENRNVIVTFGVARRPLEGAQLWRLLYEESDAPASAKALDFPRVPWVARRLGPVAREHTAMLPVLAQIERSMAWTWLRLMTYYEQRGQ